MPFLRWPRGMETVSWILLKIWSEGLFMGSPRVT
jgi:hypothetical protein